MDKLTKASEGKTKSRGGMNMDEIKEHLLSLPGADEKKINVSSRLELNRLLKIAINDDKVVTLKNMYATSEDLKLKLINTMLPSILINIILKYTETSIKVEFDDTKIVYYSQSEFDNIHCKNKFRESKIQTILGPVVLVGNFSDMFFAAYNFNSDLSNWDTKNVTNMYGMFYHTKSFNSDISNWDTSNVTYMNGMFFGATSFNSDISNWDTSKVTDMNDMFCAAENFNSDISGWNTSKVISMNSMFSNATNFNSDLSGWNTSKVENMGYMFNYATNFNQDLSKWNTSKLGHMNNMFNRATNFTGSTKKVNGVWKIIYESSN